jgi:ribosomal protein S18 acetylase RimI-like enzyme
LDWYRAGHWLGQTGIHAKLAFYNRDLIGMLAVAAPLQRTTWIRLIAVQNYVNAEPILQTLWATLRRELHAQGVQSVSILAINGWIQPYLPLLGFQVADQVVTLYKETMDAPTLPNPELTIREAYLEDVPLITAVDHAAFQAPWQMHTDELRQALRLAASASIAFLKRECVGYQICTRQQTAAHLARLAVVPHLQGHGIGAAILHEAVTRFAKRGVRSMTVNTQGTNIHSQHLYQRFGFRRNGFDLEHWEAKLSS